MRMRVVAALVVSILTGPLLLPSVVGADDRPFDQITDVITAAEVGDYGGGNVVVSGDLSTAVVRIENYDQNGRPVDNFGQLHVVDLNRNRSRVLSVPTSPSDPPRVVGLDRDGSTMLVAASWEGVENGDADGGFDDAFLVDTQSGAVTLLSGSLTDVSVEAVSISDDGDKVLFAAFTDDFVEGTLHLWESGSATELTLPADPFSGARRGGPLELSGDGSTLLYSSAVGGQTAWRARNLSTGAEQVIAGPDAYAPQISDDGSTVTAVRRDGQFRGRLFIWDTSGTQLTSYEGNFDSQVVVSSDGSLVTGTSNQTVEADEDTFFTEYRTEIWSLDVATGQRTVESSFEQHGDVYLIEASESARQIVVLATTSLVRVGPITAEQIWGEDYRQSLMIVDLDAEPSLRRPAGYSGSLDDQLVRLYEAYFGRAPDAGGLEFWRSQRAGGRGLAEVSEEFARSPEFVATYGSLSDEAFVDLVYRNVLGRAPDAGGRAFWLEQLAVGRSRGLVMVLFSESPEFIDRTDTVVPELPIAASVRRLYAGFFGRDADPTGLAYWVGEANRGVPLAVIADRFIATQEFQDLYGGFETSPDAMAAIAYGNALGRELDEAGYELVYDHYEGRRTIAEIMVAVTNSPEFIALTSTTPPGG